MKNLSLFSFTVKFNLETVKEKKTEEIITLLKKRVFVGTAYSLITLGKRERLGKLYEIFFSIIKIYYGIVISFSQIH